MIGEILSLFKLDPVWSESDSFFLLAARITLVTPSFVIHKSYRAFEIRTKLMRGKC